MVFLWPDLLWLLLALPVLVLLYAWLLRRRRSAVLHYPALALAREAQGARTRWRRHVPPLLFLLGLAALLVAAARPLAVLTLPSQQQTIMLAMDVSGSMRAADVHPDRLTAAQDAAKAFIAELPRHVRVGIVAFAGSAQLAQLPTQNHEDLFKAIDSFQLQRGTATGNGILLSLATLFPDTGIDVSALGGRQAMLRPQSMDEIGRPPHRGSTGKGAAPPSRSAEKPRRRRPSRLSPRTASGLPSTIMKGGTSCEMWLAKPAIACAPTWVNWWMPVRPPMIAWSPTRTWPASVALLARIVWWPTTQSCAMCTYAMIQLSSPIVVTPRSCTVPVLNVQNSRMVLRSPISSRVGSPAYFLSCGAAPSEANWKMRLSRPMVVRPSITQCAPTVVPAPMRTPGPMTAYGPTDTDASICACGDTMAVGWMPTGPASCCAAPCSAVWMLAVIACRPAWLGSAVARRAALRPPCAWCT